MGEIIVRIEIPDEFEGMKKKIENLISRETKEVIKRLEAINRAKGCLKTDKTWQELEAELYENVYR